MFVSFCWDNKQPPNLRGLQDKTFIFLLVGQWLDYSSIPRLGLGRAEERKKNNGVSLLPLSFRHFLSCSSPRGRGVNLLEMQIPRLQSDLLESETVGGVQQSVFQQALSGSDA